MELSAYREALKTVETEHGRFAYAEVGEGSPAVFVHGMFVSAYMWRHVMDALAAQRRCIGYNLPAHGGSTVPRTQDLSLPAQADMLESFCEALDLHDIDLVANDTGGAIAQAFAVRRPDLLRTLTLTNCEARDVLPSADPLPNLAHELASKGELVPLLRQGLDMEFARGDLGISVGLQFPEALTDDDLRGYMEPQFSSDENAREIERTLLALRAGDLVALEPGLRMLEVPTLIVWGTGDRFFGMELAQWLFETIPGATKIVEVPGGKLFWPGERPDDLVPHLREHWNIAVGATS